MYNHVLLSVAQRWTAYSILVALVPTNSSIYNFIPRTHFIPIVGVGKRGAYKLVHGDLSRQHPFGTTLRFTGPVPVDSLQ